MRSHYRDPAVALSHWEGLWEGLLIAYRAIGIKGGLGFPFFCPEEYISKAIRSLGSLGYWSDLGHFSTSQTRIIALAADQ